MAARRPRVQHPPIDVKAMRQRMGLSQTDLVERIYGERNRVHKRTIRAWEKHEQKPSSMAQQHLRRILREWESEHQTSDGNGSSNNNGNSNNSGNGNNSSNGSAAKAGATRPAGASRPTTGRTATPTHLAPGITSPAPTPTP